MRARNFAVRAFDSVRAQHAGAFSRPVWRAGAGRAAIVQGTATCTSTIGTTTTQPTESSGAVSRPRLRGEICGNYSGADQTNANAGDRQRMVSHTSPAAALPSAWGAGRFQAEGPEISSLQLVRNEKNASNSTSGSSVLVAYPVASPISERSTLSGRLSRNCAPAKQPFIQKPSRAARRDANGGTGRVDHGAVLFVAVCGVAVELLVIVPT
jgi:hypothetical protein